MSDLSTVQLTTTQGRVATMCRGLLNSVTGVYRTVRDNQLASATVVLALGAVTTGAFWYRNRSTGVVVSTR